MLYKLTPSEEIQGGLGKWTVSKRLSRIWHPDISWQIRSTDNGLVLGCPSQDRTGLVWMLPNIVNHDIRSYRLMHKRKNNETFQVVILFCQFRDVTEFSGSHRIFLPWHWLSLSAQIGLVLALESYHVFQLHLFRLASQFPLLDIRLFGKGLCRESLISVLFWETRRLSTTWSRSRSRNTQRQWTDVLQWPHAPIRSYIRGFRFFVSARRWVHPSEEPALLRYFRRDERCPTNWIFCMDISVLFRKNVLFLKVWHVTGLLLILFVVSLWLATFCGFRLLLDRVNTKVMQSS